MASRTGTKAETTYTVTGDDAPKWRIEHAVSNLDRCSQLKCKKQGVKIQKGELRIGTHKWDRERGGDYWEWRHWRCITENQIQGLKTTSGDDATKVPGYERVSEESRQQLKLALAEGKIKNLQFKDIRPDLVRPGGFRVEICNAIGYKVEVDPHTTVPCCSGACEEAGIKIATRQLRLGIERMSDGPDALWMYKHWKCVSEYDIKTLQDYTLQGPLHGQDALPSMLKTAVRKTLETGRLVEPHEVDRPFTFSKPKGKKKKAAGDELSPPQPDQEVPKKRPFGAMDLDEEDRAEFFEGRRQNVLGLARY